jgi:hypothetical protein
LVETNRKVNIPLKRHLSNKAVGNFDSTINSNVEFGRNDFGLEYFIEDSTLKLDGVDFELFGLELAWSNFSMESTQEDSIPKLLMANFVVGVIMIGFVSM